MANLPTDTARKSEHAWVIGTVTALDCTQKPPVVKVQFDDEQTSDWIAYAQPRAGKSYLWIPPQVGEQGIVLSAGGEMGFMLFVAGIFTEQFQPNTMGDKDVRLQFANGDFIHHNVEKGNMTIKASGTLSLIGATIHLNQGGG